MMAYLNIYYFNSEVLKSSEYIHSTFFIILLKKQTLT